MKINILLILGVIISSFFNFTASEYPESWIIMPPDNVMRIINNYKEYRETMNEGGIYSDESTYGIDVEPLNKLIMFTLVIVIIIRETFKKPVGKYFLIAFSILYLASFILMICFDWWSLKSGGTWLFLISISGLVFWQYKKSNESNCKN